MINKYDFSDAVWEGMVAHIDPVGINNLKIIDARVGFASVEMEINEANVNLYGIAHGGMLYTLCDLTSGITVYTKGFKNVTLQGNINYIKGGKINTSVIAKGEITHLGRSTAVSEVKVFDNADNLICTASFTMFITGKVDEGENA